MNELPTLEELIQLARLNYGNLVQFLSETDVRAQAYIAGYVIAFFALVILVRRLRRTSTDKSLARETRSARLTGYVIAIVFFGGFGAWSATAHLSTAAVAMGVISPEGSRKTIQHLEGGIIKQIHIREGESVRKGQPLVTLQDTQALARYQELRERRLFLIALETRLWAEQLELEALTFPDELGQDESKAAKDALISQSELFNSRKAVQGAREKILGQRIAQLDEEIIGLLDVVSAQDEQLQLIEQELESMNDLFEKGLIPLPRVLALRRQSAELRGAKANNRAAVARNRQAIGEVELQLIAGKQRLQEEATNALSNVQAERASIESQLPERFDALARTVVYAPTDGRVMNVMVTTEGTGVLSPGEPILDIVPDDAVLVVDARVRPQDVDTVVVGLEARVILSAFNQRYLPQLFGEVQSISADRFTDERTGEPYFLAKVSVDPQEVAELGDEIELVAGMPAEVMILTGERTFIDMLSRPLSNSLRRSFRDDG